MAGLKRVDAQIDLALRRIRFQAKLAHELLGSTPAFLNSPSSALVRRDSFCEVESRL